MKRFYSILALLACTGALWQQGCRIVRLNPDFPAQLFVTTADQAQLLLPYPLGPNAAESNRQPPVIFIDTDRKFQSMDGFGFTLTGGSATLIRGLAPAVRNRLLRELFSSDPNAIGISYLRVSIGASDLDAEVYSYHDRADPTLSSFNLSKDTIDRLPLLREILAIRPDLKIMATPWSAPAWMKTNGKSVGGHLKPEYYPVYADYLTRFIQEMAARGIAIEALTLQNEPLHDGNNPSMLMSAATQAELIKNHLGPAFRAAGIRTKIVIWDHNCDHPEFPLAVLADSAANAFIDGTAFHLYAGEISTLSVVHDAFPQKQLYFTEQWTDGMGQFGPDLRWHMRHVLIGSVRHWSRVVLEWNLASDPLWEPHTPGGCTRCLGALTIDGQDVHRNVSYYVMAHASKFVPPGSVRVASTEPPELQNVAFLTPAGKRVMLLLNDGPQAQPFQVRDGKRILHGTLPPESVGTLCW